MTMQPDELKALRTTAGMTQQVFADALGMSRKAINEMEAGKAPIERRTELAAHLVKLLDAYGSGRLRDISEATDGTLSVDTTSQRIAAIEARLQDAIRPRIARTAG